MPTSNSWMPTQGRHSVNIGSSLGRALKARKGTAPTTTKRSNLPDRDFYSFRYNFKPPSIDSTKPGTIDVKRGQDSTSVTVEQPSSQAGEGHVFVGAEHPAKEWDCVLIYDEETGTYTLEKLDSYMVLSYERKTTTATRSASPQHRSPPVPPTSKGPVRDLDLEAQLERDLGMEDADGESDNEFHEIIPIAASYMEEEEEEIVIPPRPPSPPKPKPPRATKPMPKPRSEATTVSKAKSGNAKGKKAKQQHEPVAVAAIASDAEEEDLEFGQPAKRARPSPASAELALPGPSSTYASPLPPPPPPPRSAGASRTTAALASPPSYTVAASDSEEDWDEVDPSATQPEAIIIDDPDDEGGDEEEIDVNAFEREMNQHLEESDEDFLAAAVSPEPSGRPISLNQFAGGGEASQDDDDYSSSDDSDDD